jgi:hypothetical protein
MTKNKSGGYQLEGNELDDFDAIVDMSLTTEVQVLPESVEFGRVPDQKPGFSISLWKLIGVSLLIIAVFFVAVIIWCMVV